MHSKIQPTCTPRVRNSFDSSTLHNTEHHRSASVPINHQMLLKNQIHLCAHPWHYEQTMERAAFGALRIVFQGPSISTYSGELVNPKARRRCSQALGWLFTWHHNGSERFCLSRGRRRVGSTLRRLTNPYRCKSYHDIPL